MTAQSAFDLIFRNALLRGAADPMDIGVTRGRITAIEPTLACEAAEVDVGGRLALPGFVDSHIHLDKACLLGRCGHDHGSVSEAIRAVSEMKKGFSVEDGYSNVLSSTAPRACEPTSRSIPASDCAASRR
jgi:cytosine/creatinine deaminase